MQLHEWDGKTWVRFGDLIDRRDGVGTIVTGGRQAARAMIRMPRGDRPRAIDLLGQHDAGEEMRPGQSPKRQHVIGAREHRRMQSFGASDQEAQRPTRGQPTIQKARKFLAVRHSPAGSSATAKAGLAAPPAVHLPSRRFTSAGAPRASAISVTAILAAVAHCSARTTQPPARRAAGQRRSDAASQTHPLRSHATMPNHARAGP